jgi:hypothetical protein
MPPVRLLACLATLGPLLSAGAVAVAQPLAGTPSYYLLMHAADRALYAAKARGRDRAVDVADADDADALIASPIA